MIGCGYGSGQPSFSRPAITDGRVYRRGPSSEENVPGLNKRSSPDRITQAFNGILIGSAIGLVINLGIAAYHVGLERGRGEARAKYDNVAPSSLLIGRSQTER